jgi:hypothetical protein
MIGMAAGDRTALHRNKNKKGQSNEIAWTWRQHIILSQGCI